MVEFVVGVGEDIAEAQVICSGDASTANTAGTIGIGIDQTTGVDSALRDTTQYYAAVDNIFGMAAKWSDIPAVGYHYLQWIERAVGNFLFYGADTNAVSGLEATLWA